MDSVAGPPLRHYTTLKDTFQHSCLGEECLLDGCGTTRGQQTLCAAVAYLAKVVVISRRHKILIVIITLALKMHAARKTVQFQLWYFSGDHVNI